jgi:3-oxoacyl-[acyl-carrier-protein] synthase I
LEEKVDRKKMKKVWAVADSIVSPLGTSTAENFTNIAHGYSGIKPMYPIRSGHEKILAGTMDVIDGDDRLTPFENICVHALQNLFSSVAMDTSRALLILSTTKGNIDALEKQQQEHPRLSLHATAEFLKDQFGFARQIVVSSACISGVLAIAIGKRFIENGKYDHVVVLGGDVLSEFIISGFQSLLALSNEPCRPFDENRKGINLGEGAAAILLTSVIEEFPDSMAIEVAGCGVSNDANHISGPSRTGEELSMAVNEAMKMAGIGTEEIDFISAHGTATLYNDEMEAKAFNLSGIQEVPLHSLKGYYGHTLGAAGVIETIIGMQSLRKGLLIPCLGFSNIGVSSPLNVIKHRETRPLNIFLKTSSGFGGCNAAIVLKKQ